MIKPIAFYLPQFHPVKETPNGGGQALQSGPTFQKLALILKVTTSLKYRVT